MGESISDEDDNPRLSGRALEALADFYSERDLEKRRFEDLRSAADGQRGKAMLSMDAFAEDWNASQFWYSDDTATVLAKQILDGATDESRIAIVSAPSVFLQLKKLLVSDLVPAMAQQ
ncbi:MAG: hypothetical protein M1830_003478 [Pleopsidium flavum]|nr:MAG: hypothetical protein M1830_003478 [Pleopsidium flavum]